MLALCDRFGLPRPLCNQVIEGHTVDFVWPQSRVIVETDGWQAHGTRKAFEEDRRRDAHRIANGWRPVRITWRRLETEPKEVADQLLRAIG